MSFTITDTIMNGSEDLFNDSPVLSEYNSSRILDEIISEQKTDSNNNMNANISNINIFKSLIINLEERVSSLTEEVMFLREDTLIKSRTIRNLTDLITVTQKSKESSDTPSNVSEYNENVSNYNKKVLDTKHHEHKNSTPVSSYDNYVASDNIRVSNHLEITSVNESIYENDNISGIDDDEINFSDLYRQFARDMEEEKNLKSAALLKQLKEIRSSKQREYLQLNNIAEHQANISLNPSCPVRRVTFDDRNLCSSDSRLNRELTVPKMSQSQQLITNSSHSLPPIQHHVLPVNQGSAKLPWPEGTVLILGDSIIGGVQAKLMGPRYKVRSIGGAIIRDFYHHSIPLLEKKPSFVIIMAGTNDANYKSSEEIVVELLQLKTFMENELPTCKVILSCPTCRYDDAKSQLTLCQLRKKLANLKVDVILNDNITIDHISRKGLHLNRHGSGKLAVNFMSHMKRY